MFGRSNSELHVLHLWKWHFHRCSTCNSEFDGQTWVAVTQSQRRQDKPAGRTAAVVGGGGRSSPGKHRNRLLS